jgi:hypothetical protein
MTKLTWCLVHDYNVKLYDGQVIQRSKMPDKKKHRLQVQFVLLTTKPRG